MTHKPVTIPSNIGGVMLGKLMNCLGLWISIGLTAALLSICVPNTSLHAAPLNGTPPTIQDLEIVGKQGRLLVFASLNGAFTPEVFEALHSGVTTRFTYEITLKRDRKVIYDIETARHTLVHQVKYDALKKAYSFSAQNGTDEKIEKTTKVRKEMMDWMAEINGHAMAQIEKLNPNSRYYIQVRAKLNSVDFAFPFNYMLAFLSKTTDWTISLPFDAKGM